MCQLKAIFSFLKSVLFAEEVFYLNIKPTNNHYDLFNLFVNFILF